MNETEISRLQKIIRALIGDVWHLGRENKELESRLEQAERANQDPYIAVLEAEIEELKLSYGKAYALLTKYNEALKQEL